MALGLPLTIFLWLHVCVLSHVRLFATPWAVACQAPPSVEFSRQGFWNGLPFPPPIVLWLGLLCLCLTYVLVLLEHIHQYLPQKG